jgi:hypothetical protein
MFQKGEQTPKCGSNEEEENGSTAVWTLAGVSVSQSYTAGRTPWMGDQHVARHIEQHKQNKRTQTSMSRVGYELTIPVLERAKTVYDLDGAAPVIGVMYLIQQIV